MDNTLETMEQLMAYSEKIIIEYTNLIHLCKNNNMDWNELHNLTRTLYRLVNIEKQIYQGLSIEEVKRLIALCIDNYKPSEKQTMRVRTRLEERKRVLEHPELTYKGYSYITLINSIIEKITYTKMLEVLNNLIPNNEEEIKLKTKLLDNLNFSIKAYHIKNNFSEDMMFFEGFGTFSPLNIDEGYTKMDEKFFQIMQFYFLNESKNLINLLVNLPFHSKDNHIAFVYDVFYKSTKLETLVAFCDNESVKKLTIFWDSILSNGKMSFADEINRNIKRLIKERKEQLS